jgi:uncharacterized protein
MNEGCCATLDVAALRRQPGVSRTVSIDETLAADDAGLDADVRLAGRVTAVLERERVRVSGALAAETTICCGRCLSEFRLRVPVEFEETFEFGAPRLAAGELREEHFVGAATGDALDAADLAREHALLAMPDAPLCREDCAGLCPECGANRNEAPCACAAEIVDPRLARLKSIRIEP